MKMGLHGMGCKSRARGKDRACLVHGVSATTTYTWTSSNTAAATVDAAGLATAKAEGTATIRATASNGVYGEATLGVTSTTSSISSSWCECSTSGRATRITAATACTTRLPGQLTHGGPDRADRRRSTPSLSERVAEKP